MFSYFIPAINYVILDMVIDELLNGYANYITEIGAYMMYSGIIYIYFICIVSLVYFSLLYKVCDNRASSAFYFISALIS